MGIFSKKLKEGAGCPILVALEVKRDRVGCAGRACISKQSHGLQNQMPAEAWLRTSDEPRGRLGSPHEQL